jgi:8-oxo-dGTP diphosphatase
MKKNVRPAVKAIIKQDDKYLFIKQSIEGEEIWDLPGGKVEYGESPYDTLSREVREEINNKITIIKPIGLFWFFRKKDKDQVVCITFLCKLENNKILINKNPDDTEKIIDYKWLSKDEFLSDKYVVSHISLKELFVSL